MFQSISCVFIDRLCQFNRSVVVLSTSVVLIDRLSFRIDQLCCFSQELFLCSVKKELMINFLEIENYSQLHVNYS